MVVGSEIEAVLDALRHDARGELLLEPHFSKPLGLETIDGPASSPLPAQPDESDVVTRAPTEPRGPPPRLDVVVVVAKSFLRVGDDTTPVVTYPALESLGEEGLLAAVGLGGASGFYVEPLAAALARERTRLELAQDANPIRRTIFRVIIVADARLPYRGLYEIVYTASRVGFSECLPTLLASTKRSR